MKDLSYRTDWSKGNRNNTLYYNLCLALMYDDQDGIKEHCRMGLESGLSQAIIEAKLRSAKSEIANDKPAQKNNIAYSSYTKPFKPSKKDFKKPTPKLEKHKIEKYIKTDEGSKDILLKKDKVKEQIADVFKIKKKWGLLELRKQVPHFQGNMSDRSIQRYLTKCGYQTVKDENRWVWIKK